MSEATPMNASRVGVDWLEPRAIREGQEWDFEGRSDARRTVKEAGEDHGTWLIADATGAICLWITEERLRAQYTFVSEPGSDPAALPEVA